MLIGASCPWNLSTVPTRASRAARGGSRRPGRCTARRRGRPRSRAGARRPWRRSRSIRSRRARERARRPAAPPPVTRSRHRRARWAAGGRRSPAIGSGARRRCRAELGAGLELALVERMRRERRDVRMEAPGVLEEEAEVLGHRIVVAEDVRQGRSIRAGRMRSLEGLVELLRDRRGGRSTSAAPDTASTLASAIWPASSTNSTSTIPALPSGAHSQGVPAATL